MQTRARELTYQPNLNCNFNSDTRYAKAVVSAAFYGYPAKKLKMAGVTDQRARLHNDDCYGIVKRSRL